MESLTGYILPIRRAKVAEHTVATSGSFVIVILQCSVSVLDRDFALVEQHVGSDVAAGDFAAVGTRAEVAPRFGEEVFGCDRGANAAAETTACHAVGEARWIMLLGVTSEGRHGGNRCCLLFDLMVEWAGINGIHVT